MKDLKKLQEILISKWNLNFQENNISNIAILHGNVEFSKIKGCNIPIKVANICNILPRSANSNGLIVVKSKRELKYTGYVYFEPVCLNVT